MGYAVFLKSEFINNLNFEDDERQLMHNVIELHHTFASSKRPGNKLLENIERSPAFIRFINKLEVIIDSDKNKG